MKTDTMKVGVKDPVEFAVKVNIPVPETWSECLDCVKGDEETARQMFVRGYRIMLQDVSGARDTVEAAIAGKSKVTLADAAFRTSVTAQVQDVVDNFDPTAERTAGRPSKPIVLPKGKTEFTPDEIAELLRAAGRKVSFVTEE